MVLLLLGLEVVEARRKLLTLVTQLCHKLLGEFGLVLIVGLELDEGGLVQR